MQIMQSRLDRLNAHLVACAATATAVIATGASAAVVYSGELNITIQANIDGLYVNCETGQYVNGPGAGVPGWDINPYGATSLSFFAATGTGYMRNPGAGTATGRTNLAAGTAIGASSFFYGSSSAVVGTSVGQWAFNSSGIVGFKFLAADGLTHYGWARIAIGATLAARTLVDYAFESVAGGAIAAGAGVPAPGALALLGVAGLLTRRRRA